MQKSKKVLCAVLLSFSCLAGCSRGKDSASSASTSESSGPEVTVTPKEKKSEIEEFVFSDERKQEIIDGDVLDAEVDSFNTGGVVNNNYVNTYYNLKTNFENWQFADPDQLDELNGVEGFEIANADSQSLQDVLRQGHEMAICYGVSETGNEAFEITMLFEDTYAPIENIISQGLNVESGRLSDNGMSNPKTGRGTATFRGKQVPTVVAEADSQSGRHFYETVVYIRDGQVILSVYAMSFDEDKSNDILMKVVNAYAE